MDSRWARSYYIDYSVKETALWVDKRRLAIYYEFSPLLMLSSESWSAGLKSLLMSVSRLISSWSSPKSTELFKLEDMEGSGLW